MSRGRPGGNPDIREVIDQSLAAREDRAHRFRQSVELVPGRNRFQGAAFIAFVASNMKFTRNGDMQVTLQIPYRFRDQAIQLADLFGMPLQVVLEKWTGNGTSHSEDAV